MKRYETLSYIVGDKETAEQMIFACGCPVSPFAESTMIFLEKWSGLIRSLPRSENDPATAAFGLWCRRAGMIQLKQEYPDLQEGFTGLGVCLQFVPNNIPALFAYSLAAGLLAGNSVIMRLPQTFDESTPLIRTLKEALAACPDMAGKVVLLKYPHDQEITDWLSARCDVRVIWGGNRSIADIQRSPIKGSTAEIVFPDRHSMAVICARNVLEKEDLSELIRGFFNDTYLNDQNACSSPDIIFWLGSRDDVTAAKERFWTELAGFLKGRYSPQTETAIKKIEQAMLMAGLGVTGEIEPKPFMNSYFDTRIVRVTADDISADLWQFAANGGFFIECSGESVQGMEVLLNSSCQTIAYFGENGTAEDILRTASGHGDFRIVPVGHTLDFSLNWDGQDLVRQMCKAAPEEYMLKRPDCSIFARKQGRGPYLLLIHGVAVDAEYFREAVKALENDFTVITYDRRGYSRSTLNFGNEKASLKDPWLNDTRQVDTDIDERLKYQVLDAAAVIEELAEGGPICVCGCSAGGLIALELARSMPQYVNRLFLYETAYTVDPDCQLKVDEWKAHLDEAAAGKSLARAMLAFIQAIGRPDPEAQEKPPEMIQQNMKNLEFFLEEESDSLLGYSKRHPDIKLSMPCFLGAGTFDRGNLFYEMMKHTAKQWNAPFEEVTGCHNACEDRPDEFASWILKKT